MSVLSVHRPAESSRSWSESCVGMVTRISAEGGGEKGKEMRRGERKRAERREKQRWVEFSGFQTEMSLFIIHDHLPHVSHSPYSFSYILSHSCLVFLCLSAVTDTFALNGVCLILLFMSSPYPPMCVCVCMCVWWPIPFWDTEMSPQCTISVIVLPCCSGNKDPSCELWFQLQAKL